ncbi:MAG: hypothetical protein D6705_03055 [Deltaproteobacteria bacterium]|nr:MAG: hypothetical protein D6705_03055 [Deltaproteobacteria bacterium]
MSQPPCGHDDSDGAGSAGAGVADLDDAAEPSADAAEPGANGGERGTNAGEPDGRARIEFPPMGAGAGAADPVEAARVQHSASSSGRLDAGSLVGRYVIVRKLGAGGMGAVFAAYDPELDRKVAIKVLHPRPGRKEKQARRQARLLREAQAMAKLSHPNVVAVFDVGTLGDRVYVAMAYVEGKTLRDWLEAAPRTTEEILDVMVRAGRGLAAAHRQGFVHRDFKPDNVMVGDDGRAFVMDFGLVRADDAASPSVSASSEDLPPSVSISRGNTPLASNLTRVGAMLGTPAYMAPEQFEGRTADARSDQFAFCVTLWEALYGERPFAGRTVAEIGNNVLHGRITQPKRGRRVPGWLRRILERGLEVDPAHRFPDMDALLAAIGRGRARRKQVRIAAGLGAVLALAAGWQGYEKVAHARKVAACEAEGARIEEVWNDAAKARVRGGIEGTKVSYAAQIVERLVPVLDGVAQEIGEASTAACMARDVEARWSEEDARKAEWCLDGARANFAALVDALAEAAPELADVAVDVSADLQGAASACVDERLLPHAPPPPEGADPAALAAIRRQLTRAAVLTRARARDEALAAVDEALEAAEALGWPPLVAEARSLRGLVLRKQGKMDEAVEAFLQAYFEAAEAGAWGMAGETATRLGFALATRLRRPEDARAWAGHAKVAFKYAGVGEDDPRWADYLTVLGLVEDDLGDGDKAMETWTRALELRRRVLGPTHPSVGALLNNMATVHSRSGRNAEAAELYAQAYDVWLAAHGPEHPSVGLLLNNRSVVEQRLGRLDDAQRHLEEAKAIFEKAHGPDHPMLADVFVNLGSVFEAKGDYEAAARSYERALEIREKNFGPDHPDVGSALTNLGNAYAKMGDRSKARRLHERALAIMEKGYGPKSTMLAYPLTSLAEIALEEGRPEDAIALAERAANLREAGKIRPEAQAESRFALARALWEAPPGRGRDRARARAEAERARELLAASTAKVDEQRRAVEAWLAAHAPDRDVATP